MQADGATDRIGGVTSMEIENAKEKEVKGTSMEIENAKEKEVKEETERTDVIIYPDEMKMMEGEEPQQEPQPPRVEQKEVEKKEIARQREEPAQVAPIDLQGLANLLMDPEVALKLAETVAAVLAAKSQR